MQKIIFLQILSLLLISSCVDEQKPKSTKKASNGQGKHERQLVAHESTFTPDLSSELLGINLAANGTTTGLFLPPPPAFLADKDLHKVNPIDKKGSGETTAERDSYIYKTPVVPGFVLSNDGRISFGPEISHVYEWRLNVPEKLEQNILDADAYLNNGLDGHHLLANEGRPYTYRPGKSNIKKVDQGGYRKYTIYSDRFEAQENGEKTYGDRALPNSEMGESYDCETMGCDFEGYNSNPETPTGVDHFKVEDTNWTFSGHNTVCDSGANDEGLPNPYRCGPGGEYDCYRLDVVSPMAKMGSNGKVSHFRLRSHRVEVKVSQPKTAAAEIVGVKRIHFSGDRTEDTNRESFVRYSETVELKYKDNVPNESGSGTRDGYLWQGFNQLFEPNFTADGKLLVGRVGPSPLYWNNGTNEYNASYTPPNQGGDTPYIWQWDVVYMTFDNPCDVRDLVLNPGQGKTSIHPISYAPYDSEVNSRYSFAAKKFKSSSGLTLPPDYNINISYPWIDKQGKNIFGTTLGEVLFNENNKSVYSLSCYNGGSPAGAGQVLYTGNSGNEVCRMPSSYGELSSVTGVSPKAGVAALGSWTNGKLVLLDGSFNPHDFGLRGAQAYQRYVGLYQNGEDKVFVRIGANTDQGMNIPYTNSNINIINSFENIFNYNKFMKPKTPRDMVWTMLNGRGNDEVVFDDLVDPNVLIYSDMNASLELFRHQSQRYYGLIERHRDGVQRSGNRSLNFDIEEASLQNLATGFGEKLIPPSAGVVSGSQSSVRVENVALGGYKGKGFYLNDGADVTYHIPQNGSDYFYLDEALEAGRWSIKIPSEAEVSETFPYSQPNLATTNMSYMVFLDSRLGENEEGKILTFPSGQSISFKGKRTYIIDGLEGGRRERTLAHTLAKPWMHFTLAVDREQNTAYVYINGFISDVMYIRSSDFNPVAGNRDLVLGAKVGGFKGWIDEFKVITRKLNFEEYCNHAFGSMVQLPGDSNYAQTYAAYYHPNFHQGAESHPFDSVKSALDQIGFENYLEPDSNGKYYFACHTNLENSQHIDVNNLDLDQRLPEGTLLLRDVFLHKFQADGEVHDSRLAHDKIRPDTRDNNFCMSCHESGGVGMRMPFDTSFGTEALTNMGVIASDDLRRQPFQPNQKVFGNIIRELHGLEVAQADPLNLDPYIFPTIQDEENPPGDDTTAPNPPGIIDLADGTHLNSRELIISGTCESEALVKFEGSGLSSLQEVLCANGGYSLTIRFSPQDGPKNFRFYQVDLAGNISEAIELNIILDTAVPAKVLVTTPSSGATLESYSVTVSGTCESGARVAIFSSDLVADKSFNCNAGIFSTALTFITGEGSKNLNLQQFDKAENESALVTINYTIRLPGSEVGFSDNFDSQISLNWDCLDRDLGDLDGNGDISDDCHHSFTSSSNRLKIKAQGGDIWGSSHQFTSLYQSGIEGDFEIRVKLTSLDQNAGDYAKAGLFIANNILNLSEGGYLLCGQTANHGSVMQFDSQDQGVINNLKSDGNNSFSKELKLTRTGNEVKCYFKNAGTSTWVEHKFSREEYTGPANLAQTVDFGLIAASASSDKLLELQVDDFVFLRTIEEEVPIPSSINAQEKLTFPQTRVESRSQLLLDLFQSVGTRPVIIEELFITGSESSSFELSSAQAADCTVRLEQGEDCALDIGFEPLSTGNKSASLKLEYRDGVNSDLKSVVVALEGFGLRKIENIPSVISAPESLNFGWTFGTRAVSKQLLLNQTLGTQGALVQSISISGQNSNAFAFVRPSRQECIENLNLGENCSLNLRFSSVSGGTKRAQLRVSYFNGVSPILEIVEVELSGRVFSPIFGDP